MKTVIIDYGAGNVRSVQFALERVGVTSVLSSDVNEIQTADKVIFPGVGNAKSAMEKIKAEALDALIPDLKQPVLGICLGMQLLAETCEEGDTKALGIFPTLVKRFNNEVKIPQMGWNEAFDLKGSLFEDIADNSHFYFVHSYYMPLNEYTIARGNYGLDYSAAVQKANFYGCQFHPEKSGELGEQVLRNFLKL